MSQGGKIKPTLFILSTILVVALGWTWWRSEGVPQGLSFELKDASGRTHTAQELRGQHTLVHFWASWCASCLDEIPALWAMAAQFEGTPLHVLALSLDDTWADANAVLEKYPPGKNVTVLLDPKQQTPAVYGSYQFPETYWIGPDLKVVTKWVGPQPWDSSEFQVGLRKLLKDDGTSR